MGNKRNKLLLIGSLVTSLFSVAVASISTAAWFAISNPGQTIGDQPISVETGDSNLSIQNINAYKTTYDELESGKTDYSNGHVTSYNIQGNTTTNNINQGKITGFDIPEQGIGYYIVGNDVWAVYSRGLDYELAWKYESGLRMDDDIISGTNNKAMSNSVYLKEGTEFKIRHYTYVDGKPQDVWPNVTVDTGDEATNTALELNASGNIEVKEGQTGYYNIYLLNSNKIHIYPLGDLDPEEEIEPESRTSVRDVRPNIQRGVIASGSHFFFKPTGEWTAATSTYVVYVWKNWSNVDSNKTWYKLDSANCSSGYYHTEILVNVNKLILLRYDPNNAPSGTSGSNWPGDSGIWARSVDLNLIGGSSYEGDVTHQVWELSNNNKDGSGKYNSFSYSSTEADLGKATSFVEGWYMIGAGGTIGGVDLDDDWRTSGDIHGLLMDAATDTSLNQAEKKDVVFKLDDANTPLEFKIKYCGPLTYWHDYKTGDNEWGGYYNGGGDNITCKNTTICPPSTNGGNVKVAMEVKADIYLNNDKHVYVYPRLTVTEKYKVAHKEYTSASATTVYTSSWETYKSVEITYNDTYTPTNSPSHSGTTWGGAWYKSFTDATTNTAWSTSEQLHWDTEVYTIFNETNHNFKIKIAYTDNLVTHIASTESATGTYAASKSTTISNAALNAMRNALTKSSKYTWYGYYWSSDSTLSNAVTSIAANTMTAEKTLYAVYKPTAVPVYKHVSYWYEGSNDELKSLSDYISNTSEENDTAYKPENYAVPSALDDKYRILQTLTLDGTNYLGGLYKFKFEGWYLGSSTNCDYQTEYVAAEPTGSRLDLYARMVMAPEDNTTIYVDFSSTQDSYSDIDEGSKWDNNYTIYHPNTGGYIDFGTNTNYKLFPNGYIYKVSLPNNDSNENAKVRFIQTGQDVATAWHKTIAINTGMADAQSNYRGECEMITIWSKRYRIQEGSTWSHTFNWSNFTGEATGGNGYYLVGTKAFTGSTETEWSFNAARKMTDNGTLPAGISGTCIAYYDNLSLKQGMEFKIYQYDTLVGKTNEYYVLNNDTQTQGIASNDHTNIKVNMVDGDKFSIYLIRTDNNEMKIVIYDNDQATFIFFNQDLHEYNEGQRRFTMGYGDHTTVPDGSKANLMIYETGIRVTQKDIDNGLSFAIRDKRAGATTWYSYADDIITGDTSLLAKGAKSTGNNGNYGDEKGYLAETEYGFKFTTPDFYKFYLTKDHKISIAPYPGAYGEGYYVIPYNSEDAGPNRTDYYTNGIKLKDIPSGYSNKAVYTCYTVTESNLSIFFRAYLSGKDITTNKNGEWGDMDNEVYCSRLDPDSSSLATMTDGVLTFDHAGSYNIYLSEQNDAPNGVKVSIVEYTVENFFKLNSINKDLGSQDEIKQANTSLVLEVDFTTVNSNFDVTATAQMITTSATGSSQYVDFSYSVIDDVTDTDTNDHYLDYDNCYEYMRARRYIGSENFSGHLSNGAHKMFILIDYKYSALSSVPTSGSVSNNFYFILKMTQVA